MKVRTLCLAVLSFGAESGYEINKQFETGSIGIINAVRLGWIYPALTRPESEDLSAGEAREQEDRRDKRTRRLTGAGRAALRNALSGEPAKYRVRSDTAFMLFFGHLTAANHLEWRLVAYLAWRQEMVDKTEAWDTTEGTLTGQALLQCIGLAIYRAKLAYTEMDPVRVFSELRAGEGVPPRKLAAGG